MLAKPLVACTYLSSIVSELFEPQVQKKITIFTYRSSHFCQITLTSCFPGDALVTITQYVAWLERKLNSYKCLAACTYLSSIVIRCLNQCVSTKSLFLPHFGLHWGRLWYWWKSELDTEWVRLCIHAAWRAASATATELCISCKQNGK